MSDADPISRGPRPVRKQRRTIADVCQEEEDDGVEDIRQDDVAMGSPPPEIDGRSSQNPGV